ncbi:MAG: hypothetical protein LUQ65_12650, partial [Candidatus Helarchaeota archaeon]|nr:hypothetical protein [Candidatus Helarchaeota archaeon]
MRKIILILVFVLLGVARLGYCFDVTVSYSDFTGVNSKSVVQTACDTVLANGGGNVYLPAGTSGVWTGALNIQGGVNLIGAGSPMTSRETITSYGLNLPQGQWTPAPTTIIRNGTDTNALFIMMNYPTYTAGKVR